MSRVKIVIGFIAVSLALGLLFTVLPVLADAPTASPTMSPTPTPTSTARPDTYMDPIPDRINAAFTTADGWISGTSLWGATWPECDVTKVEVQIKRAYDGWCWNSSNGTWDATSELWNNVGVVQDWIFDQWAWRYNASFNTAAGDLISGWIYTVWARAVDADGYWDPTPSTDAFTYDDEAPDVSFTTMFPARIYSLSEITGSAHDEGIIQQVRLAIYDVNHNVYWNGFFWQPGPVWIKTQGTSSWSINTTTNPPLPEWQNNVSYEIWAQASDNADNRDFDPGDLTNPGYQFLYRKNLTNAGCYLDQLPTYANSNPALGSYWIFMDPAIGFSGTSKTIPAQNIVLVAVEIKDVTSNVYWDNILGAWNASVNWSNCPNTSAPIYDALDDQWDWNVSVPGALTWQQGHTYQVRAQATDDSLTPKTYVSSSDSFTYDTSTPGSWINAFDVVVFNTWSSLTGGSIDTNGQIGNVVVLIEQDPGGLLDSFWNGAGWGDAEWGDAAVDWWDWIFATSSDGSFNSANELWKVTTNTSPCLPLLRNDEDYHVEVFAFDKAGNEESTATKDFTFRVDLPLPAAPDLKVIMSPDPIYACIYQQIWYELIIFNNGTANASDFYVDIYHNLNQSPVPGQRGNGRLHVDFLAANDSVTLDNFPHPSALSPGVSEFWAQVDTDQNVAESNEGNNVYGPVLVYIDICPTPTPSPSPTPTSVPNPGDVNDDGVINCLDITRVELCILYPVKYPKENYCGWDANEDEEGPNAGDILAVEMRILGTWPPPP